MGNPEMLWAIYKQMDLIRQVQGWMLHLGGAGPAETPYRVILSTHGLKLRDYGPKNRTAPALLLIPAPIKRAYLWDLSPQASVVRTCLRNGARVFLVEWGDPEWHCVKAGLAGYADSFILDCLKAIEAETGNPRVFLAGHSLGGTLAAIFASLHPERLQGIILLGSPLSFKNGIGPIWSMIEFLSQAQPVIMHWRYIPGSFLSTVSCAASPKTFLRDRWKDWLKSLPNAKARDTHLRVTRWMLDEAPLSRQLFIDVAERLYRRDCFMSGELEIEGRRASPELIYAPVLSVVDRSCSVAPPKSVLPFIEAVRSAEKKVIYYEGDSGTAIQHIGILIGESMLEHVWPQIVQWTHDRTKRSI
jgi:polyhydroxyalkanoate synthase